MKPFYFYLFFILFLILFYFILFFIFIYFLLQISAVFLSTVCHGQEGWADSLEEGSADEYVDYNSLEEGSMGDYDYKDLEDTNDSTKTKFTTVSSPPFNSPTTITPTYPTSEEISTTPTPRNLNETVKTVIVTGKGLNVGPVTTISDPNRKSRETFEEEWDNGSVQKSPTLHFNTMDGDEITLNYHAETPDIVLCEVSRLNTICFIILFCLPNRY